MRDILIYGAIYSHEARDYGITAGITDVEFAGILANAGGEELRLRINSRGGDADAGFSMVSQINDYPGKVEGMVDAMAGSIAGVILQACKPRVMASNAAVLVHHASLFLFGGFNEVALKGIRDELVTYDERQAIVFAEAMGKAPDEIIKMFDGETSLKADDAIKAGLADTKAKKVEVKADVPVNLKHAPPKWLAKRFTDYLEIEKPVDQEALYSEAKAELAFNRACDLVSGFGS